MIEGRGYLVVGQGREVIRRPGAIGTCLARLMTASSTGLVVYPCQTACRVGGRPGDDGSPSASGMPDSAWPVQTGVEYAESRRLRPMSFDRQCRRWSA